MSVCNFFPLLLHASRAQGSVVISAASSSVVTCIPRSGGRKAFRGGGLLPVVGPPLVAASGQIQAHGCQVQALYGGLLDRDVASTGRREVTSAGHGASPKLSFPRTRGMVLTGLVTSLLACSRPRTRGGDPITDTVDRPIWESVPATVG